jgi:hypothetical protein
MRAGEGDRLLRLVPMAGFRLNRPGCRASAPAVDDMSAAEGGMDQHAMLKIRDRLQRIEDELVEAGFDEFMVACDAGTFTWRTVQRARAEGGEEPPADTHDGGRGGEVEAQG